MYQERLASTRTKKVIEHSPTGAYLLNTHALHNYRRILSVLSPDLRKQLTAAIVTDHDSLRLHAATLLRAAKVSGGESAPTGSAVDTPEQPAPAFVKAAANGNRKSSRTTKAKGKGKGNPPEVAPDNAAASTSANHTSAASTAYRTPPTLPANPVVPPPAQYYSIPPHPLAPSYYTTLDPYTPGSLQALPGQGGHYWVRPASLHQPVYAPAPGIPTVVPQPESNVSQDFSYHQWGSVL